MKKTILLGLLCLATLSVKAQESKSATTPFYVEATLGTATPYKKIMPVEVNINAGYQFTKRFSVQAILATGYMITKNGRVQDYNTYINLGGGMGFVLFPASNKNKNEFTLRATFTSSVNNKGYSGNTYSAGLYWYMRHSRRGIEPIVGAGYRCTNYRLRNEPSYTGAFISFGIRY